MNTVSDKTISDPGAVMRLRLQTDPATGKTIRSHHRQTHVVYYAAPDGRIVPYHPGVDDAAFRHRAAKEALRLLSRPERRVMWRAERKRAREARKRR